MHTKNTATTTSAFFVSEDHNTTLCIQGSSDYAADDPYDSAEPSSADFGSHGTPRRSARFASKTPPGSSQNSRPRDTQQQRQRSGKPELCFTPQQVTTLLTHDKQAYDKSPWTSVHALSQCLADSDKYSSLFLGVYSIAWFS